MDYITNGIIALVIGLLLAYITLGSVRGRFNAAVVLVLTLIKFRVSQFWAHLLAVAAVLASLFAWYEWRNPWSFLLIYAVAATIVAVVRGRPRIPGGISSCRLGDPASEEGRDGLRFVEWGGDGRVKVTVLGRTVCRQTSNRDGQHYIYFAFTEERVAEFARKPIAVVVQYFDLNNPGGRRGIELGYDATGDESLREFTRTRPALFVGSERWRLAAFAIENGFFGHRQHGVADFRLSCQSPNPVTDYELAVCRVWVFPM